MMNVEKIIREWLQTHGYDGLMKPDECSCIIGDLCCCCETPLDCEPAYKCPITPCRYPDEFGGEMSGGG